VRERHSDTIFDRQKTGFSRYHSRREIIRL